MKKIRFISLLLCLVILLQCAAVPVRAAQPEDESTDASADTSTEPSGETQATVPNVAYGAASITNGCRTVEGQVPLAGSERLLETAQAVFLYERTTETVIYSYCADIRLAPGSLSKIMTAMIALEEGDLDDVITVSTREISQLPVGAITAKLREGEQVTLRDLLYCLILSSANDAALLIAAYIDGNEAAFVERMNRRALEIGCTDTYFTNCHGLDDPQQYTTARDVAKITLEAVKSETFVEIFGAKTYTIPSIYEKEEEEGVAKDERRSGLTSGNHLVYDLVLPQYNHTSVTGGMPSYVSAASGASIAFTAENNGMSLVCVILGAKRTYNAEKTWKVDYYGNFDEAFDLLEYTFNGYKINRVLYEGQALRQFTVANGENDVVGYADVALDTVLPVSAQMENLYPQYSVTDGGLSAPIAQGQQIGTVQLWYNSSCVAETELYAMSEVRPAASSGLEIYGATRDDSDISGFLGFLGIVFLIVLVPTGIYLGYNSFRRSMARARRRRRRASRRRSR